MTEAGANAFKDDAEALAITLVHIHEQYQKLPDEVNQRVDSIMQPMLNRIGETIGESYRAKYTKLLEDWKQEFLEPLMRIANRIDHWKDEVVAAEKEAAE